MPTLFLCFLFVRPKIKPNVFRENDDWAIIPISPKPFVLSHRDPSPSPMTVPYLPMVPPQRHLLDASPCYLPTGEGQNSPEERALMPGHQQEGAEKRPNQSWNITSAPILPEATEQGKILSTEMMLFPPEVINSNLCREKIESAGRIFPCSGLCRVRLEWGLYCSLRWVVTD